jgi:hypothetical protein
MVMGTPAPLVRACVDSVDAAIREQSASHGMSTRQRAWLACGVTAVLVPTSMGWARFDRASLGTDALAAWSGRFRPRQLPWDELLGARGRVLRRHEGLSWGRLVRDATDHKRSPSANTRAHLDNLRDKESGG